MLKILLDFIAEAQYNNKVIKGPKDLPKNFLVDSDLYYITSLLNNKFNLKLTFEDVEKLLKEENISTKKTNVQIPNWYYEKWLRPKVART